MYDPQIARFLQEDTYTGDPGDPLSLNLYTYCHNEPIMYWDPTGHADLYNHFMVGYDVLKQNNMLDKLDEKSLEAYFAGLISPDLPDLQIDDKGKVIFNSLDAKKEFSEAMDKVKETIKEQIKSIPGAKFVYNIIKEPVEWVGRLKNTVSYWFWESSYVGPIAKNIPGIKDTTTLQSHYGNLQYWHSMADSEWSAKDTHTKVVLETNKRVADFIDFKNKGDLQGAYFSLGKALHYLTDSWTPSHTERNSNGEITMFQVYGKQDLNQHSLYDDLFRASRDNYNKAVANSTALFKDAMNKKVDSSKYYKLSPKATVGVSKGMEQKSISQIYKTEPWKKADEIEKRKTNSSGWFGDNVVKPVQKKAKEVIKPIQKKADEIIKPVQKKADEIFNNAGSKLNDLKNGFVDWLGSKLK